MRSTAPAWDEALSRGKESVTCDLKAERDFALALLSRADVVLEGFRPGVAERLGVGPAALPETVVYCSITGFGVEGRNAQRAGHDLNYLGWAGALADTAPGLPPVQSADLAAGALAAVNAVLAALVARGRDGRGRRVVVSMTHGSHRFVSHRLDGEPVPRLLTGGLACYRIYATADGRWLTVAALEPKFFAPALRARGPARSRRAPVRRDQEALAAELAERFAGDRWPNGSSCRRRGRRSAPGRTIEEAAAEFGGQPAAAGRAPAPGEHTAAWRARAGLSYAFGHDGAMRSESVRADSP